MYPEHKALAAQAGVLAEVLDQIRPEQWTLPTRCTEFDLRLLVAHLTGALHRYTRLSQGRGETVTLDRVKWWQYDPAERAPVIAERTKERTGDRPAELVLADCRRVSAGLVAALERDPADVAGVEGVTIRIDELAAVAVLEMGVHTMDISHAVGGDEPLDPSAAAVISAVLDRLLGAGRPEAVGWDDKTYVLTATGRRRLTADDTAALGPLAGRFPLLA